MAMRMIFPSPPYKLSRILDNPFNWTPRSFIWWPSSSLSQPAPARRSMASCRILASSSPDEA